MVSCDRIFPRSFHTAWHLQSCSMLRCILFRGVAEYTMWPLIHCWYLGGLHFGASGHKPAIDMKSRELWRSTVFKETVIFYTPTNCIWALWFLIALATFVILSCLFVAGILGWVIFKMGWSAVKLQCGLHLPNDILLIFLFCASRPFVYLFLKKNVFNFLAYLKKWHYWVLWCYEWE